MLYAQIVYNGDIVQVFRQFRVTLISIASEVLCTANTTSHDWFSGWIWILYAS